MWRWESTELANNPTPPHPWRGPQHGSRRVARSPQDLGLEVVACTGAHDGFELLARLPPRAVEARLLRPRLGLARPAQQPISGRHFDYDFVWSSARTHARTHARTTYAPRTPHGACVRTRDQNQERDRPPPKCSVVWCRSCNGLRAEAGRKRFSSALRSVATWASPAALASGLARPAHQTIHKRGRFDFPCMPHVHPAPYTRPS